MSVNVIIISDPAKHDYGPSRPPLLLANELSKDNYNVTFISPVIGLSIRKMLLEKSIKLVDFGFPDISKDSSKNMFLLWNFENLIRVMTRKYKRHISDGFRSDSIVINFSNIAIVESDIWYAQGPFSHAFMDMDWKSYPLQYLILSHYVLPIVKLFDIKHVRTMRKLSRLIVANSRFTSSMYESLGINVDCVIHPPIDVNIFKPLIQNPTENYVLTYIGKETDFRVLSELAKHGVNILAFGSKEQVLPKPLQNNSYFRFIGRVSTEELIKLYSNALYTLFPFTHEPFGYIPLESIACGTPVITYNKQGPSEVITHDKTGWLARDTKELVKIALDIWRNGYPKKIRTNARKESLRFDISNIYPKWKKILNVILELKGKHL